MASFARLAATTLVVAAGVVGTADAQQCCTGSVATYCTAGTSVQGCVPQVSWSGVPSFDVGSGFTISVVNVPGQRAGTIFYGFYEFVTPWAPGSPSFKCIASPVQRTGNLFSGGTIGLCDGDMSLDFNVWRAAHPAALGAPFATGQTIRAQAWYRDPAAPAQTNLSNAITFSLCGGSGDITPPTISACAPDQVASANGSCQGVVPDFTSSVVVTDNCTAPLTIQQTPVAGILLPLGAYTVAITVTDAAGNSSQCVSVLTVADRSRPTISQCAASVSVVADSSCQASIPDFASTVVASDNCGGGSVVVSQSPPAGTIVDAGAHAIYITAVDAAGNIGSCGRTLTVSPTPSCIAFTMVEVPPGTFLMGQSGTAEPTHLVSLSYSFWVSPTEVTQLQYQVLMGSNPSFFAGQSNNPVERVTWSDAMTYCALLTRIIHQELSAGEALRADRMF